MKKLICLTIITLIFGINASANRFFNVEVESEEKEESKDINYATQVPGPSGGGITSIDFSKYEYNGTKVKAPDFSKISKYNKNSIQTFENAVSDFYGWDGIIGTIDLKDNIFTFEPIDGLSLDTNFVTGYANKKFLDETIKFEAKIETKEPEYKNWVGFGFRNAETQVVNWGGNNGYLLVFKEKIIEIQQWNPGQKIIKEIPHNAVIPGKWQVYEFKLTNLKDNTVEIKCKIDGNEIFSFIDTDNPILDAGYINLLCYEKSISIKGNAPDGSSNTQTMTSDSFVAIKENQDFAVLNGEKKKIEGNSKVVSEGDTLYLPLRFFATEFGFEVNYNDEYKIITLKKGGSTIDFTVDFCEYKENNNFKTGHEQIKLINSMTYIPIKTFSEICKLNLYIEDDIWMLSSEQNKENNIEVSKKLFN